MGVCKKWNEDFMIFESLFLFNLAWFGFLKIIFNNFKLLPVKIFLNEYAMHVSSQTCRNILISKQARMLIQPHKINLYYNKVNPWGIAYDDIDLKKNLHVLCNVYISFVRFS